MVTPWILGSSPGKYAPQMTGFVPTMIRKTCLILLEWGVFSLLGSALSNRLV